MSPFTGEARSFELSIKVNFCAQDILYGFNFELKGL